MNSEILKTKVLHYYRFRRRFFYIATECGPYNSDILVSNGRRIVEIEVKTSERDLLHDFKKKKHLVYRRSKYCPNYFLFAVPSNLVSIASKFETYGVISVDDKPLSIYKTRKGKKINYCSIVKIPKLLTENYSEELERDIIMRSGSELIRTRLKLKELEQMKRIVKKFKMLRERRGDGS